MGTSMRQGIAGSVVLLSFSAASLAAEFGDNSSLSSLSKAKCTGTVESSVQAGSSFASGQDRAIVGRPCLVSKQLERKIPLVNHQAMPLLLFLQILRSQR